MMAPRILGHGILLSAVIIGATATKGFAGDSDGKTIVAFRLTKWIAVHIDDSEKAKKFADDLGKIGCEVQSDTHNGHTDVQYRMIDWGPVEVANHEAAQTWIRWLGKNGFETLYGFKPDEEKQTADQIPVSEEKVLVTYRMTDWNSRHAHKPNSEKVMTTVFGALGCEIELGRHGDHADVKFRCPEWMTAEFRNHDVAHSWIEFLQQAGFETQHEH